MKALIKEEHDDHYDQHMDEWEAEKFNVGERRVLLTYWVAKAWKRLHSEYKETIIKTFQHVGLSLNPDGSQDEKLKIRDLPDITVGDYHRNVDQQQESDEAAAIAEIDAACAEAEEDADHKRLIMAEVDQSLNEEILRPKRDHRKPAQNRYFTSKEAEGDPLCVEDSIDETTDTNSNPGEGWDSEGEDRDEDKDEDKDFNPDEDMEDTEMVEKDYNMSL
jgi:hypothetical protein